MQQDRTHDLRSIGGLIFTEDDHAYKNAENVQYRSCTGILSNFKNKFDSEGMSKYKAIKDVLSEDHFTLLKRKAGWENVKNYWESLLKWKQVDGTEPFYRERLLERRQHYLDKWNGAGTKASTAGSIEHGVREHKMISDGKFEWDNKTYQYQNKNVLELQKDDNQIVIPEMLLWDHSVKLGGLADIVISDNGYIHILDYKTNRTISKEGFDKQTMLKFLSHLPDASFYHYSLQLQIYQKMVCDLSGLLPGECWIISTKNIEYDRSEDVFMKCADLKDEVSQIFDWLKTN
jgi:hypothetical protein